MNRLKRIFAKIIVAVITMVIVMPCATYAASNLPMADVGDHGSWTTPENIELFKTSITDDMENFRPSIMQLVSVPIEVKIGLAMMNGFSMVADVLD